MKVSSIVTAVQHFENEWGDSVNIVIAVCSHSGRIVQDWVDAGYTALLIDKKHMSRGLPGLQCPKPNEPPIYKYGADVDELEFDDLNESVIFIAVESPCTHISAAGARWWKQKDADDPGLLAREAGRVKRLLHWAEDNAHYVYCEQPRGRAPAWMEANGSRRPDRWVQPHWYAGFALRPEQEAYTKRTYLWLKNIGELPRLEVEPIQGDRTTRLGSRDKEARSLTPQGLAHAVFQACHPYITRTGALSAFPTGEEE